MLPTFSSLAASDAAGTAVLDPPTPVRRRRRDPGSGGGPPEPPEDDGGRGDGWGGDEDEDEPEEEVRAKVRRPDLGWLLAIASIAALVVVLFGPRGTEAVPAQPDAVAGEDEERPAPEGALILAAAAGGALLCARREERRGRRSTAQHWLLVTVLSGMCFALWALLSA